MNIFSIFDPMTSILKSYNWLSILIIPILTPQLYWFTPNRFNMMWFNLMMYMIKELKMILYKKIYYLNFCSLFIMIMLTNFMGLFPYIFTSSSHMIMSLTLSLPLWLSFMLIGWIYNTNHMFAHQVPSGTPPILMPFMVLIETISNIIRPLTLSVRLSANMIAGHLLLTLMSNNGPQIMLLYSIILILTQTILMALEMSVSMIQAYVFTILTSLYSKDSQ